MRRIVVCLLIAFASASVVARESKLSDADGGSCPSHSSRAAATRTAARDAVVAPAPANKTKASSVQSGGGDDVGNRLQSPRWHRFLPGMFR